MEEENKKLKDAIEAIEVSVYYCIDLSFTHFKNENPTLELVCDKKTMDNWYDLIRWSYAQGHEDPDDDLKREFDIEISPLIESAINQCVRWYYKYNSEHIDTARSLLGVDCESCDGKGTSQDDECEECDGSGQDYDATLDSELPWDTLDEVLLNIMNSCNVDSFKELSKISI